MYTSNKKDHGILEKMLEYDKNDKDAKNFTGKVFVQNFDLFNIREVEKSVRENTDELTQMNRFQFGKYISAYTENFPEDLEESD